MFPDVTFAIGGVPIEMGSDWQFNSVAQGGYDQFRGNADLNSVLATGSPTQGSVLTAHDAAGAVLWEGVLANPPYYRNGVAKLVAHGYQHKVRISRRKCFQSRDYSQWVPANGEPFVDSSGNSYLDHYKKIAVDSSKGKLEWRVDGGVSLNSGASNRSGFVFWEPETGASRFAATLNKSTDDNNLEIQLLTGSATGATIASMLQSDMTVDTQWAMSAANPTGTEISASGLDSTVIQLALRCKGDFTSSGPERYWLTKVRIGLWPDDTALVSEIITDTCDGSTTNSGNFAWDPSGVTASTVLTNVLPLDWTEDWAELFTYLAELEDWRWRVLDNRGSGPYVEYGPWTDRTYTTSLDGGCSADLEPQTLYNVVRVGYTTSAGATAYGLASTSITGITGFYYYEADIGDSTPDIADAVADSLLARLSQPRYTGRIELSHAYDSSGADRVREILGGDCLTITDWEQGSALTVRVDDVSQTANGVSCGIEAPVSTAAILAGLAEEDVPQKKRHRKHKRHH